jgi:branched-chain amino acid transport system ATP-binding protein
MPLQLQRVRVAFGAIQAVREVSLEVEPGRIVAVIGPNGAGKTTLITAVIGLTPHAGRVVADGQGLELAPAHRRSQAGLGYVPAGKGVFSTLTVREHVRVAAGAAFEDAWRQLVDWFPVLDTKQGALGSELSGGQQQIVSIARAMATGPKYLLMDEPSMGLSPIAIRQLAEAITTLRGNGVGILLTEQNAGLALSLSDACHVMVRGEVRLSGLPAELRNRPEVEALYLGRTVDVAEQP